MKKVGIIIFVAALVTGLVVSNIFTSGSAAHGLFNFSMDFSGEEGSGRMASEIRDLKGFSAVEVGGVFQVDITAGRDFEVEVEADDNLLPMITTEVDGDVLKIGSEGRISPSGKIRVRISAPDINRLDVSGAAHVTLTGLRNSKLAVDASGASKLKLAGETAKFTAETSGASKIDAEDLKAVDANIDASGASHVDVNISGELTVDLSGASKVVYSGTPTAVHKNTSGAGNVSKK